MINASQIKWIKNVKRDKGDGWAYMEYHAGAEFFLNWPKRYIDNPSLPLNDDIILLFQKVNKKAFHSPGTYLTHLVTPIEKEVRHGDNPKFPHIRKCRVIANAGFDNLILKPAHFDFRNLAWGDCRNIQSLKKKNQLSVNEIQQEIWNLFAPNITLESAVIDDYVTDKREALSEKIKDALSKIPPELKKRVVYQSDRQDTPLIRALKKLYNYECQFPGCNTKILKKDGSIYIEVAHIIAVKDGGKSSVENLIPLCPNHHKEFDYGKLDSLTQTNKDCTGILNGKPFKFHFKG